MNDLRMGFKHTILQRLQSLEMCTAHKPTMATSNMTAQSVNAQAPPTPTTTASAAAVLGVTDFSINRILSEPTVVDVVRNGNRGQRLYETTKKNEVVVQGLAPLPARSRTATSSMTTTTNLPGSSSSSKDTLDILDLSKTANSLGTALPAAITYTGANSAGSSSNRTAPYQTFQATDFLAAAAAANATRFYAHFFPHIFPSYAAGVGSFQPQVATPTSNIATCSGAAAMNSNPFPTPYQKQRYFSPYIVNSAPVSEAPQPPPPSTPSTTTATLPANTAAGGSSCNRLNCGECLDFYQNHPAYKSSAAGASLPLSARNSIMPVPLTANCAAVAAAAKTSPNLCTTLTLTTATNIIPAQSYLKAKPESELLMKLPRRQDMISSPTNSASSCGNSLNSGGCGNSDTFTGGGSGGGTLTAEEISYKCRICDKVFGCSLTLQAHEKTHKSPRYECTDCGKGFSQLRNYKYHLSVHRGTKEFAAECPECGKTFNDKGYLSSHMKIHRNKKEYECPYCPKSFNQRVAFNMHVRIHTGVKPHKCAECGKRFSRKMLLKQHMRTHSGEKPYQCSVCGKSFADRSNMTLHHRLHSGIKPFNCPICPKAFTKKHHLKTHLNYHTGCKPYVCPHPNCKQAFTQSSNMRTHAKKCQYRPLVLPFPVGGAAASVPSLPLPLTVCSATAATSTMGSLLPSTVSNSSGVANATALTTAASNGLVASEVCIPTASLARLSGLQAQQQQQHLANLHPLHAQLPMPSAISAGIRMLTGIVTPAPATAGFPPTQQQLLPTLRPF